MKKLLLTVVGAFLLVAQSNADLIVTQEALDTGLRFSFDWSVDIKEPANSDGVSPYCSMQLRYLSNEAGSGYLFYNNTQKVEYGGFMRAPV